MSKEIQQVSPSPPHHIPSLSHLLSVVSGFEVDEGEPSWAAGLLVVDDADICKGAVLGEDFSQISLCGVETQAKHTQARVGIRIRLEKVRVKIRQFTKEKKWRTHTCPHSPCSPRVSGGCSWESGKGFVCAWSHHYRSESGGGGSESGSESNVFENYGESES